MEPKQVRARLRASRWRRGGLVLVAAAACGSAAGEQRACTEPAVVGHLGRELRESSGLAASRQHPGILWSHNDSGGDAAVIALDTTGAVRGRVTIRGARNRDWEDIAVGPCPAGSCLYIADTGDNEEHRKDVAIYRVPEPDPSARESAPAERLAFRYASGPRDAEALFVLPSGEVYLVTKGRRSAISVFRLPTPHRADAMVMADEVQRLSPNGAVTIADQVTAADAVSPARIAIRSYSVIRFYRLENGRLEPVQGQAASLGAETGGQGEALALRDDGVVFLTSEAERGATAPLTRLHCSE